MTRNIKTYLGVIAKDTPYKIVSHNYHHIWIMVPSIGLTKLRNIASRMRPPTDIEKIIYED